MRQIRVASRYAKSLIGLATEREELETTFADMQLIHSACEQSNDLSLLLKSPVIKPYKKGEILNRLFKGKISETTLSFLHIITRKGREAHIPAIAETFILQYKVEKNIATAKVTSAGKLTDEQRSKILAIVEENTGAIAELTEEVDSTLIGGFILNMGDKQYDASSRNQLNKLKHQFSSNTYEPKF